MIFFFSAWQLVQWCITCEINEFLFKILKRITLRLNKNSHRVSLEECIQLKSLPSVLLVIKKKKQVRSYGTREIKIVELKNRKTKSGE